MNKRNFLKQDIIDQAKSANLIDYMLTYHPDKVFSHYGIRDREHDSLVLYPDSFCRYSNMEVQDGIHYLQMYQGYRWRDAVLALSKFAIQNCDEPQTKTYKPGKAVYSPGYSKKQIRFFTPVNTKRIGLITDYLHKERGISLDTIKPLIQLERIYASSASGYGKNYVCFANPDIQYYCLRNISNDGFPKLQFSKKPNGFWWFSPYWFPFCEPFDEPQFIKQLEAIDSPDTPLYLCESPIDAVSLYELIHEPAIYTAMGGLKINSALEILRHFPAGPDAERKNRRKVFIATDNDRPGRKFTERISLEYERICPILKDWNEDLLNLQQKSDPNLLDS